MPAVEIVVGDRWKDDVLHLGSLRSIRPSDASPRLSEFRDVIDFVVFGDNWTADVSEENIFPFFSDLVSALANLANGDSAKEIIEFPASPYELTLVGSGEHLLLTFMSIDREHDVLGFDVPVLASEFVHAVCKACERLLADLLSLDEHYASDPFVRHFGGQLAALARRRKVSLSRSGAAHTGDMAGATSRVGEGRELTFSYEMSLTSGFVGYHGEPTFDWHALLLPGQILVESDGHHVTLGGRFPIFTVVSLLRRVREVLNHTEAGRARFACRGRLPGLMLFLDCNDGLTRIEVGPEPALIVDTTLDASIDVLLSLSRLIIDDIHRQNPDIKLNVRFDDIDSDIRELQAWFEDVRRENRYFERPEAYLHSHAGLRPHEVAPPEPSFGWPLKDVRAVYPSRKWVWPQSSIHFSAVNVIEDMVLVPSLHGLVALDASTGQEQWAIAELDHTKLASFTVAGPHVVVANERGQRALVDRLTGNVSATSAAGSPILVSAAHFATHDLVVVADYRSNLMGIRPNGEAAWSYTRGQGTAVGAAFPGPIVATLSQPGVLSAFDPLTGDVLWRVRLGAAGHTGPFDHEGRIYAITHEEITDLCTLHSVHPFTGRTAWKLSLEGIPLSQPAFFGGKMAVVVEHLGQLQLMIVDLQTPEIMSREALLSAGLDRPTHPLVVETEDRTLVVVRTDRAEMTCVDLQTGECVWRYRPAAEESLLIWTLPVFRVRDSLLCAGERLVLHDLQTGEVLHNLTEVFEAPEFLHAGGQVRMIVGESGDVGQPDTLTCYSIEHFLALVS